MENNTAGANPRLLTDRLLLMPGQSSFTGRLMLVAALGLHGRTEVNLVMAAPGLSRLAAVD